MTKKRIVWITGDYFIDVDKLLVPYIQDNYPDWQVDWYVLKTVKDIPLPNDGVNKIFNTIYRGKDPRILLSYFNAFKDMKLKDADIIYSDFLGVPYYFPFLKKMASQTPIVHAAHNVIPYHGWPSKRLMTMYVNYIFRYNQNFHLFSYHLQDYFNNHFPGKDVFVCPMAVKSYGEVMTNKHCVNPEKVNLLFFGNIKENKRLDLLINAIKSLDKSIQDRIHLTVAGKCDNPQKYKDLIGDCECITTDFRRIDDEEVPELFCKHQYLVLPYEDVAQSGPHMIAYNYNLPVIASDVPGFAERIENEKNGFVFKANDTNSLASILRLVSELAPAAYQQIVTNLTDYVKENHSVSSIAAHYMSYFYDVYDKNRSRKFY